MTVGKAIYYLLTNSTDITDIVSTRVFPEIAQQDAEMPYIVYNIANNEPSDTKPEPSKLDTAQVDVNVYSQSYTQCIDLAVAVRAALDRVSGTYSGVNVQSIQYLNEVIDFDEMQRAYNITSDYDVRISRTNFEIAQGSPITGVKLGELSDVDVVGVTDNQILSYDAATDSWIAADDAGGLVDSVNGQTGTVTLGLDDLTDVDAGAPTAGQLLAYGQGDWTTISQDEITIGIENVTGLQAELNTIPANIRDLDDVTIAGPTLNQLLQYNGTAWVNANLNVAQSLDDLTDVDIADQPANGALLQYNSNLQLWQDSGSNRLPTDGVYYHDRYQSTAASLRAGATATTELYYAAQADGDGFAESASSDTPTTGYDIQRKLYYSEAAFADPDTGTWIQFAAIADNTTFANAKAALLAYLKERTGGTVPISLKQTWEEVQQAPSFTGLLNESYGSGAEAAYSTRRLNGNVTECMVIRRASDSTTQTIGFDGSGNIDESAIETFCTGTTCTVVTWKDQSGNGNDATASDPAYEPTIYTGGALVKENGKVALDFDGSNDYLDYTGLTETTLTSFHVAKPDQTNSGDALIGWDGTTGSAFFRYNSDGTMRANFNGGFNTTTNYSAAQNLVFAQFGTSLAIGYNGATAETGSATGLTSTGIRIGQKGNVDYFNGKAQEMVVYASDKSAVRTDIESNIGDYFTQNTPLLDTYSGAAAAYSLRLLDSTYTGSAVEVYNGSSYADIGFNVFGELDTVALAAHCGSNNGFVSKWYDQSGNSNTAAQTTTAAMPKIYDGTTGVVTENGKPAIDTMTDLQGMPFTSVIQATNQFIALVGYINNQNIWIGSNDYFGFINNLTTAVRANNISEVYTSPTVSNQTLITYTRNGSESQLYQEGSSLGTSTALSTQVSDYNGIGTYSRAGAANFKTQEIIIYDSDQSSNRTNIEDNINTFYNIY